MLKYSFNTWNDTYGALLVILETWQPQSPFTYTVQTGVT